MGAVHVSPPATGPTPQLPPKQAPPNQVLDLSFGLTPKNETELKDRVSKGETIPPNELDSKYWGDPEKSKKLTDWLASQGFKSIEVSKDYTSVYAKGTVGQIEKSLGANMVTYSPPGSKKSYPSAMTAPTLPVEVGAAVTSINGLQPWIQATGHAIPRAKKSDVRKALGPVAEGIGPVPRPQRAVKPAYKIVDVLKAYDADNLVVDGEAVTGAGQTIGILINTGPLMSDVAKFWKRNGLKNKLEQVVLINVSGQRLSLRDRTKEETLDVEWVSGIAPGATIRVYAAGSFEYPALNKALDRIGEDAGKPDGLRILSISLGLPEVCVPPDELKREATKFLRLAAIGVTTFVSSGDRGSNPSSPNCRNTSLSVEYESSDTWVIAVGGTTLDLDTQTGKVLAETGWIGSGGGVSGSTSRPTWQPTHAAIQSSNRMVPDVSSVADNNPGGFVIYDGKDDGEGGTSWSAPTWAGFAALIRDARQKQGKPPLGFLGPALYAMPPQTTFRDITIGTNGGYQAAVGWDPVTGIGTPDVKAIIQALP
jgi:kumamolisin